ncbi:MAG: ABC transporter ATP-binding protein, partial [Coriobacteriales bacterium]|nr:ABC transporter ATP-binding protein [Coriobacteriales bacterium]
MIELIDLAGAYHRRVVVQEVSLRFSAASITAVIGPNGCGKSTLLKLCCGHLAQHSGQILVEGQALRQLSRRQIAQRISYMPQRRTTPDISAESLVLHGRFCWLGYPRVYGSADR